MGAGGDDGVSRVYVSVNDDMVEHTVFELPALHGSRVDTDVDLEVAYSCNIFDVSDSLTYVLTYNQVDATLASLSILKYGALK